MSNTDAKGFAEGFAEDFADIIIIFDDSLAACRPPVELLKNQYKKSLILCSRCYDSCYLCTQKYYICGICHVQGCEKCSAWPILNECFHVDYKGVTCCCDCSLEPWERFPIKITVISPISYTPSFELFDIPIYESFDHAEKRKNNRTANRGANRDK